MDFKGRTCTLYPLDLTSALIPPGYEPAVFVAAFQENLAKQLTKAGLLVRYATPGIPDGELIYHGRLVRIEKGSRWMSVFFAFGLLGALLSGLASGSVFEVQGALGDATAPFAQIESVGKSSFVTPLGKNESGIKNAARIAGLLAATRILKALKTR